MSVKGFLFWTVTLFVKLVGPDINLVRPQTDLGSKNIMWRSRIVEEVQIKQHYC